jgi:nucleoside-diphosphate-sugar epimerase
LDLTDADAVAHCLSRHGINAIVHLAASLDRSTSAEARARQWHDTFEAGRVVIEQAVAHHVQHLLIAGTLEELGDHDGLLGIDRRARPQSVHGLCKSLVREIAEHAARCAPLRVDWFRPFVIYGPGQTGEMLVPSAFRAAAAGQACDFTDGRQRRDFLFVDDLVRWMRLALGLSSQTGGFHLHHLGTGTSTAVRDVLEIIQAEFPAAQFRLGAKPRRPGEPDNQVAPSSEGGEPSLTTWTAAIPLREGLQRTAAWWRHRR